MLDVALRIVRDLADAHTLTSALADDLDARAHSDGQLVHLMHAHIHAIVLLYRHVLELTRANPVTGTCAIDPELVRTLNLGPARVLADAIAANLAGTVHRAHSHAVELADFIDLDMSVLSAFDFDIVHAMELASVHATGLDRAHVLAHGLLHDPEAGLAAVFGIAGTGDLGPALPLPELLGLPLRGSPRDLLASTLLRVLAGGLGGPESRLRGRAVVRRRGRRGHAAAAALGRPLTDRLGEVTAAVARRTGRSAEWNEATVLAGGPRRWRRCPPCISCPARPAPPRSGPSRSPWPAMATRRD